MSPDVIKSKQPQLAHICASHDISYLGLFGSFARGEQRPDSDVDLLVEFTKSISLFQLMRAKLDFEDLLDRDVDIVLRRSLKKPRLIANIEHDLVPLYEQ